MPYMEEGRFKDQKGRESADLETSSDKAQKAKHILNIGKPTDNDQQKHANSKIGKVFQLRN